MSNRLPIEEFEEAEPKRLVGTIQEIVFHGPESGFTVARFSLEADKTEANIVGNLVKPAVGERLALDGEWSRHPKYGRQFQFHRYESLPLDSAAALERYLGSGLVKGVGPATAKRLVDHFGADLERVLDGEPERLKEVSGFGEKKTRVLARSWQEQRQARHLVVFLQQHGISPSLAARIFRALGERALATVRDNPYALTTEVYGVGFKTADRMAQSLGLPADSRERLRAGIHHALQRAATFGHVFLPEGNLLRATAQLLATPGAEGLEEAGLLEAELEGMEGRREVVRESLPFVQDRAIYAASLHSMEVNVASRLSQILGAAGPLRRVESQPASPAASQSLTAQQRAALDSALNSKVCVITGGPGVGKTTCLRALVSLLEASGAEVALASPTGRAAKRLAELSGQPASTLHRLLDFDPFTGRCLRSAANPLPVDAVIVDEASMLDLWLADQLLQALPDQAQLILVGDADQLPPVGPGNVLVDIIRSGRIPVARLTEVFRQAQESLIVTNAHRVNRGEMPELVPWRRQDGKDCLFIWEEDPAAIAQMVCRLASEALPGLGYGPHQIQVITPMHKGEIGTVSLNRALQAVLNPGREAQPGRLRGEDRVMQTANNYEKGVFNGDIGYVKYVSRTDGGLQVQFPEQVVSYAPDELDQLQLAYVLTAHKSQGSEYPATIVLVHPSHSIMLQRNLLYTALTRAMRLAVLVGTPEAVRMAVENDRQVRRYTALAERLRA